MLIMSLKADASPASRLIDDPGSQSGIYNTFRYAFSSMTFKLYTQPLTKWKSLQKHCLLGDQYWEGNFKKPVHG